MSKKILAHIAIFSANLIYGINYTVAKDVMPNYIEPLGFIFLRVSGAGILFWGVFYIFFYEKVEKKDLIRLALCGLFGVAINQILFFEGLNLTTPINAAVIMVINPILVILIGSFLTVEIITSKKIFGIVLGAIGAIILITYGSSPIINLEHLKGNVMILINATSYAMYLVLAKPLMKKYKPITVISWVFFFGFIYVFPFGWSEYQLIEWSVMPKDIFWKTVFVVFCTTFLAYLFNIFGLKTLNTSTVSTYIYLQPVLASIVAILLGSDELSIIKILSTLIIFAGVYLVSLEHRQS